MKDMQELLNELVKQNVFKKLEHYVKVLNMEGGSKLVEDSFNCICELKAKLAACKTKLLEEEKMINSEKMKALRISDRWGSHLLSEVSLPKQKALSTDECEQLIERLYPDREKVDKEFRKRAEKAEQEWKQSIGIKESISPLSLSSDQVLKLLGRLHPDPFQKDWKLRIGMKEELKSMIREQHDSQVSDSQASDSQASDTSVIAAISSGQM